MNIVVASEGDVTIVSISGRLDSVTVKDFEAKIGELLASGAKRLVLDCAELEYVSSAGLRMILATMKKLRAEQGAFSLCGVSNLVREVMAMSGFDRFLAIFASKEEAVKAAGTKNG